MVYQFVGMITLNRTYQYTTGGNPHLEHRKVLGSGGFGEVHEIYNRIERKSFARKILTPFKDYTLEDMKRETANILNLGSHPNLVNVIGHATLENTNLTSYYIDMELCDYDLHEYIYSIRAGKCLIRALQGSDASVVLKELLDMLKVMNDITNAAMYIHRKGNVHRDIKPKNILRAKDRDGNVVWKLSDFGDTKEGTSVKFKHTPDRSGTPGYRAPELLRDYGEFNNKADIWGLGCVMLELLNGQKVFNNDADVRFYAETPAILTLKLSDPADGALNHVLEPISTLLSSMIAVEPGNRNAAAAVLDELKNCRQRCWRELTGTGT